MMKRFFFILFFSKLVLAKETIYLIRDDIDDYNNQFFSKADLNNRMIIWGGHWEANMWLLAKELLEKNCDYELRTPSTKDTKIMFQELRSAKWVIDNTHSLNFSYNLDPKKDKWLLNKLAIVIFEPPVVQYRNWSKAFHDKVKRVFTWDDSYVCSDPTKYFLLRFPFYSGVKHIEVVPFNKKKLCCAINGNKGSSHPQSLYEKRREDVFIWDLNYANDFDFYGTAFSSKNFKTYKGALPGEDKIKCLHNYKFCLSYENMHNGYGWVTERMFNCLEAGCVPVYLGSINIDNFVPRECYIDRNNFESNEHLYDFLNNMNESQYNRYIENIKDYLNSNLPNEFGYERFAEYIVKGLLAD